MLYNKYDMKREGKLCLKASQSETEFAILQTDSVKMLVV